MAAVRTFVEARYFLCTYREALPCVFWMPGLNPSGTVIKTSPNMTGKRLGMTEGKRTEYNCKGKKSEDNKAVKRQKKKTAARAVFFFCFRKD
ncbi:MAG: hypothetical protein EGQ57_05515 [Alphaproteobacteria bacterium]|nr:hypothetical protein [Alphaproteobacteria bacterium]